MIDKKVERDFARSRFSNKLRELALVAPTTKEALVALTKKNMPWLLTDRAFLLVMGLPKDIVKKVMQIYRSCYGNILARDNGKDESHHHDNSDSRDHYSSRRGGGGVNTFAIGGISERRNRMQRTFHSGRNSGYTRTHAVRKRSTTVSGQGTIAIAITCKRSREDEKLLLQSLPSKLKA